MTTEARTTDERTTAERPTSWHRIDAVPDEGRVQTAIVDGRSVAVTRCGGRVGALDNHCPHQGGPLGEGSIENGLLRCPWHGYDYDPTTGRPPDGFSDAPIAFSVEECAESARVGPAVDRPPTAGACSGSLTRRGTA
jgi:nitrite reductase/ring-hydroxylating ferredoxin subunit